MKSLTFFFFSFLFLFLVAPMISAQQDINYEFNKKYDFKRTCLNNGTFCSGATACNVTITRPNGDLLVNNQQMTNQVSFHNFTVSNIQNNILGVHPYIMSCTDGTSSGGQTGNIIITADGKAFQIFPIQLVFAIFAMFFISIGLFNEKFRLFKHMGSIVLSIFGIVTLFPGYSFINWTTLVGKGIGFSSIALGFYFLIEDSFSRDNQDEYYQSQRPRGDDLEDGRFHG